MGISFLLKGLAGAVAGLAVVAQLPTSWWLPDEKATVEYLAETELKRLDGSNEIVRVSCNTKLVLLKLGFDVSWPLYRAS